MKRAVIGTWLLGAVALLFIVHMNALKGFWYWRVTWFDSIVHILGGMVSALIIAFVFSLFVRGEDWRSSHNTLAALVLFGVLAIGIAWEVFEYLFNVAFDPGDGMDTIRDLFMDIAGGLVVYGLLRRMIFKHSQSLEETTYE